jgi:hypothetical protein
MTGFGIRGVKPWDYETAVFVNSNYDTSHARIYHKAKILTDRTRKHEIPSEQPFPLN